MIATYPPRKLVGGSTGAVATTKAFLLALIRLACNAERRWLQVKEGRSLGVKPVPLHEQDRRGAVVLRA
jgi:hypothetical protein